MASKHAQAEPQSKTLRIVLVGKTGLGKSASGNTILGRKAFESKTSSSSVTEKSSKEKGEWNGQSVVVVDTPGLFGTIKTEKVVKEIKKCISFASPGPHVFLVAIQTGRFTKEEKDTVNMIQITFGEQADCYTMVLFTKGDNLDDEEGTSIDEMISENQDLNDFVERCDRRYHVFNNKNKDPSQVTELLQKINKMVEKNGGKHYTNAMFQEAEEAITAEMQRVLMENPGLTQEEARKRAEKDNTFLNKHSEVIWQCVKLATDMLDGALSRILGIPDICKLQ